MAITKEYLPSIWVLPNGHLVTQLSPTAYKETKPKRSRQDGRVTGWRFVEFHREVPENAQALHYYPEAPRGAQSV